MKSYLYKLYVVSKKQTRTKENTRTSCSVHSPPPASLSVFARPKIKYKKMLVHSLESYTLRWCRLFLAVLFLQMRRGTFASRLNVQHHCRFCDLGIPKWLLSSCSPFPVFPVSCGHLECAISS